MSRSKFNVDKDIEKRTFDGITFDSKLEMKYYKDVLLPMKESGEVSLIELQKKYVLQEGFEHDGRRVQPIYYVADFYVEFADGRSQVIDTKGMPDSVAIIKRKLFWNRYPELDYVWISYVKKFGGWGLYDDHKRLRNLEKRSKKELKEENNDGKD